MKMSLAYGGDQLRGQELDGPFRSLDDPRRAHFLGRSGWSVCGKALVGDRLVIPRSFIQQSLITVLTGCGRCTKHHMEQVSVHCIDGFPIQTIKTMMIQF